MPRGRKSIGTAIACVIVDDHEMLLDLLVGAVGALPGLKVVGTATDVSDAARIAAMERIDLLIVDRKLPSGDGMSLVRAVKRRHPALRCIVIAGATTDFVCPRDLMDCVVSVVDKSHACDLLLAEVRKSIRSIAGHDCEENLPQAIESRLTPRENQLFKALGEGLSNKELAQRLEISTSTVETHRKSITRKLGLSGAALIRLAAIQSRGRIVGDRRSPSS